MTRCRPLPILALCLAACVSPAPAPPAFTSELSTTATPWTHDRFDAAPGKFTFAVFGDLNGGPRAGIFEVAVRQLALLRPELIMSVGDLIDAPTEDTAALNAEWDAFDQRAREARAPVFRVGGNHDLTGEVLRGVWLRRYGQPWYHFVYRNVLFLVLDTEDHTPERMAEIFKARNEAIAALDRKEDISGMEYSRMPERVTGNIGPEQSAFFRRVLAANPSVRWTMLFMHKPVWRDGADPEFTAIEDALGDRPYTVFTGHLHSLSRTVRRGRDYLHLGTTGGSQGAADSLSFDHLTLVTMDDAGPSIAHLRLDGILDPAGRIPDGGTSHCYQASRCGPGR